MKKLSIIPAAVFIFGLIACAAPPVEEMNAAHDAVTRAENDADVVAYAGAALLRARDALARMQAEADAKRYDAAKALAAEAVSLAEKAAADGKAGADRARAEAAALINGLAGPLAETADALNAARAQNLNADFDALSQAMDTARENYNNALQDVEGGNYKGAAEKAQNTRALLADIASRLTRAAQNASRKK